MPHQPSCGAGANAIKTAATYRNGCLRSGKLPWTHTSVARRNPPIKPLVCSLNQERTMKARAIVLTLVTCFVGLTLCLAQDANMGTWKLNEAKSKLSPGAPKNTMVIYEAAGDNVK